MTTWDMRCDAFMIKVHKQEVSSKKTDNLQREDIIDREKAMCITKNSL